MMIQLWYYYFLVYKSFLSLSVIIQEQQKSHGYLPHLEQPMESNQKFSCQNYRGFSSVVKLKATFLPEMISLFPCYLADRILPGWLLPDSPALSCNPSAPLPTPVAQAWESFCTKITLTHSSCLKISIIYSRKLSLILGLGRVTLLYIPL